MPIPYEKPRHDNDPEPRPDEERPEQDTDEGAEFDRGARRSPDYLEPSDEEDDSGWPDRVRQDRA
jgi:hypothetical protein